MRSTRHEGLVILLSMTFATTIAAAQETGAAAPDHPVVAASDRVLDLFPAGDLYPHYIADPLRAQSAMMLVHLRDSEIPSSGDSRFMLRLGGRFPILRIQPDGRPDRGWQLDFNGGFVGVFDRDHSLDNIGWDGLYGLTLSYRPGRKLGLLLGTRHDSAHVGDEYAERVGRRRIDSTREEIIFGLSWHPETSWRTYAEAGYGFGLEDFQERGRLQLGVEHLVAQQFWHDRVGWYAAVDSTLYEERDWQAAFTAQLGLVIPVGRGSSRYRLALELRQGRSVLGEFSFEDETYIGVGWFFDF